MSNEEPVDPELEPVGLRRGPARSRLVLAIALGGALGAPARYEVSRLLPIVHDAFPWATFWTNLSGSLALGFVLVLLVPHHQSRRYARPFLATGFIGAYTTFSTFAVETDLLIKDGHGALAAGYVLASVVAGLAVTLLGMRVARLVIA